VERNKFRFTEINNEKTSDGIKISMNDYANSLEDISDIRPAKNDDPLTRTEMAIYRKFTGKIAWLAANTHPDLAFTALDMAHQNHSAKIKDLKRINKVLERIHAKPSEVMFRRVGKKEDLMVYGLADGSFKLDDRSVGGDLVILGNKSTLAGVPVYWKLKTIKTICHSAKAVETRSMTRLLDDTQFFTLQLRQLLFGNDEMKSVPIKIFSNSKPLLESIGSIHQIEEKLLRHDITKMKDSLYDGVVTSFSWLDGQHDMIADILTKECRHNEDLERLVKDSTFRLAQNDDNLVVCNGGEIKFLNHCNKKK
jgi:hypothetical protein